MRKKFDVENWARREHFEFFSQFTEPFHGITAELDLSIAYQQAKKKSQSFFMYYLYRALKAMNEIENFRLRIDNGELYLYDQVHISTTVLRSDNTFGFSYIDFQEDEGKFLEGANIAVDKVKASSGLDLSGARINEVHCSALPWVNFTSLSHARNFSYPDSCPKISFAKLMDRDGRKTMAISLHAHHALVDGYHVGLFMQRFQQLLDQID